MSHLRHIGVITGAALLLTATACSTGKNTLGELSFRAADSPVVVSYTNTPVQGCHKIGLPRGAAQVVNNTQLDVVLYRTPECQKTDKAPGIYIPMSTSNVTAPDTLPWRSFSVVH
ncbi:hypothetical protein OG429_03990 [Streptomyces sp. NBC_00190]|uniref:hypothetical protein n=1 Tax=unclassified Streptomyces TaxID=2593676 RepID=UPI002E2E85B6|nr:hypothetical protein [Streptomyces sp. NBC_00190]WSZ38557.1 hypothetical protein OG239_06995 [Streptomyces sp. NBC_00868]